MSKIEWKSEEEKFEAIGYLAKPGVINYIEATVPRDKLEKFKQEYVGRYTEEFPYVTKEGSKFGYQFRIYLNDIEGCPESLENYLDEKYKNRINDTRFIAELVNKYGFMFTRQAQDFDKIERMVKKELDKMQKRSLQYFFTKGYQVYRDFLWDLSRKMLNQKLPEPNIVEPKAKRKSKGRKTIRKNEMLTAFTRNELFKLGWLGETYIYKMLGEKNEALLSCLGIELTEKYTVEYFNHDHYKVADDLWEDKSIGKGCDIIVTTDKKEIYIEVKSSKRKNPMFIMTSNEMQKMRDKEGSYYLIKIDYLENILKGEKPEIMVFDRPYETFFKPERMTEAMFKVEGDINE